MDKAQEIEMLKQALNGITNLRELQFGNRELPAWKDRVSRTLESIYGKESTQYKHFVNASGKAFIVRTAMGQDQEYHRQLDCYEEALKSLLPSS